MISVKNAAVKGKTLFETNSTDINMPRQVSSHILQAVYEIVRVLLTNKNVDDKPLTC